MAARDAMLVGANAKVDAEGDEAMSTRKMMSEGKGNGAKIPNLDDSEMMTKGETMMEGGETINENLNLGVGEMNGTGVDGETITEGDCETMTMAEGKVPHLDVDDAMTEGSEVSVVEGDSETTVKGANLGDKEGETNGGKAMAKVKEMYMRYAESMRNRYGTWYAMYLMQAKLNRFIMRVNGVDKLAIDDVRLAMVDEVGEMVHEFKCDWAWWTGDCQVNSQRVLEEAVDFLHFYLTLMHEYEDRGEFVIDVYDFAFEFDEISMDTKTALLGFVESAARGIYFDDIEYYLSQVLANLGFDEDDVWNEYVRKSFENYMRQVEGGRYAKVDVDTLVQYWKGETFIKDENE